MSSVRGTDAVRGEGWFGMGRVALASIGRCPDIMRVFPLPCPGRYCGSVDTMLFLHWSTGWKDGVKGDEVEGVKVEEARVHRNRSQNPEKPAKSKSIREIWACSSIPIKLRLYNK